jgi:hypothetical protein
MGDPQPFIFSPPVINNFRQNDILNLLLWRALANGDWRVSEVPFMGILASAVQPSVSRSGASLSIHDC